MLHFGQLQEIPDLAQLIQQQAAEAGFTLELAGESLDTFYGAQWCPAEPADPPCSGAAELGIVDYGHRATPDVYLNAALSTGGIWNSSQYSSPEFDALFTEYQAAIGVDAQTAACGKIEEILARGLADPRAVLLQLHLGLLERSSPASGSRRSARCSSTRQPLSESRSDHTGRRTAVRRPASHLGDGRHNDAIRAPPAGAVGRHAVSDRHDRLPHQQRLPERHRPAARRTVRVRRCRSIRSTRSSGTNDPLIEQYGRMVKGVVTFDFGDSYAQNKPVSEVIGQAFWRSLKLARLRARAHDPAEHHGRHLRRPPAGQVRRPIGRHARSRQLVDPGVRVERHPARRSSESSSGGSTWSPRRPRARAS